MLTKKKKNSNGFLIHFRIWKNLNTVIDFRKIFEKDAGYFERNIPTVSE